MFASLSIDFADSERLGGAEGVEVGGGMATSSMTLGGGDPFASHHSPLTAPTELDSSISFYIYAIDPYH